MALLQSNGMALGTAAPPFSLPATDGETYALADFVSTPVLVIVFTCNHCPYAIACEDRLVALQDEYKGRAQLVAINPNDASTHPGDSFPRMVERARDKGFNFPYLRDESQAVARAYDAVCTPDVFVFDAARELVYNGRIDDNWRDESAVTRRDLQQVIDQTIAGAPHGLGEVFPAMGCSIKWKR